MLAGARSLGGPEAPGCGFQRVGDETLQPVLDREVAATRLFLSRVQKEYHTKYDGPLAVNDTEQPGEPGQPVWRQEKGRPLTLILTAAGRRAAAAKAERKPSKTQALPADRQAAKKGTKLALLTDLLRRKGGATINEASETTGWLPHFVRGAVGGALKKRLQLAVLSESIDGQGWVYRIAR